MEIKKIASFSADEVTALTTAGGILGNLAKGLAIGDVTEIAEESTDLISALKEVIEKVSK